MEVTRVGGAGHGLHQPVHGQYACVGGEHAVSGQTADHAQHHGRVGQPVQQHLGDRVGGVPGQDPQHLPGQRVISQPVQRDAPDPGDGTGGVPAFGGDLVHCGRVAGQQAQVLPRAGAGLSQVGTGLLNGQRQEAQLRAQLGDALRPRRLFRGQNRGQQGLRLGRVQHVQPDRHHACGVPAGRAAAGDQVPAGAGPRQQRRDVSRVTHVVQDHQPPRMSGQPLHRPFPQRLQRQHPGQRRLQRDRHARQSRVDVSRAGSGNPPGQTIFGGVSGGPPRGQRALADPAQAVHRLHHHAAWPGHRRIQPGQLARPAHEQPRPRQVRQPRRGAQLRPRPERLLRQRRLVDDLGADLGERAGITRLPAHLHPGAATWIFRRYSRLSGGHGRG